MYKAVFACHTEITRKQFRHCCLIMQQAVVTEQIVPEAWTLYFPDEGHSPDDRRAVLLQDLLPRFTSLSRWLADRLQPQQVTGRHRLSIGFEELQKVCSSSEFSAALDLQPVEALACLGAAAHQASKSDQPRPRFAHLVNQSFQLGPIRQALCWLWVQCRFRLLCLLAVADACIDGPGAVQSSGPATLT